MAKMEGSQAFLADTVELVDPVAQRKAGLYAASRITDKDELSEILQMLGIKETPASYVMINTVDRKPMGRCGHYLDGVRPIQGGVRRFCKTCRPEWIKDRS